MSYTWDKRCSHIVVCPLFIFGAQWDYSTRIRNLLRRRKPHEPWKAYYRTYSGIDRSSLRRHPETSRLLSQKLECNDFGTDLNIFLDIIRPSIHPFPGTPSAARFLTSTTSPVGSDTAPTRQTEDIHMNALQNPNNAHQFYFQSKASMGNTLQGQELHLSRLTGYDSLLGQAFGSNEDANNSSRPQNRLSVVMHDAPDTDASPTS